MQFRTKITVTYFVLLLLLAFILGAAYHNRTIDLNEKNEYANLEMMTEKISQQFEENIKPMEFISEYILSDVEVLDALTMLAAAEPDSELSLLYAKEAEKKLRLKLNSYYIIKNYYRVLVYNSNNHVIASDDHSEKAIDKTKKIDDLKWIDQVKNLKGTPVLIGVHEDDWSIKNKEQVYSIVKEIQGMSMGYIEVQKRASELKTVFSTGRKEVDVVVVKPGDEILYTSKEINEKAKEFYIAIAKKEKQGVHEFENPVDKDIEVISSLYSKTSKVSVLLVEKKSVIIDSLSNITPMTIFITICILAVSLVYIIIMSGLLTKPMRQLRVQMEKTGIETLEEKVVFEHSNDEIEALSSAYQLMLHRLNEAIIKERKHSRLQMQAQYDTLQAQVNPHFLYNVLNTISYRGVKNNDETICDMCYNLAYMLRYSTNNKERQSKIHEEIDYLEKYFYLLKKRYEHMLEYSICIDEQINNERIPKITLQQIVENSITHGFSEIEKIMKIQVRGWKEKDWWYIEVIDNGQGMSEKVMVKIKKRIEAMRELLCKGEESVELEIGGMGLVSNYARLYLLYNNNLIFEFSSDKQGTKVRIGAPVKEKGDVDV